MPWSSSSSRMDSSSAGANGPRVDDGRGREPTTVVAIECGRRCECARVLRTVDLRGVVSTAVEHARVDIAVSALVDAPSVVTGEVRRLDRPRGGPEREGAEQARNRDHQDLLRRYQAIELQHSRQDARPTRPTNAPGFVQRFRVPTAVVGTAVATASVRSVEGMLSRSERHLRSRHARRHGLPMRRCKTVRGRRRCEPRARIAWH